MAGLKSAAILVLAAFAGLALRFAFAFDIPLVAHFEVILFTAVAAALLWAASRDQLDFPSLSRPPIFLAAFSAPGSLHSGLRSAGITEYLAYLITLTVGAFLAVALVVRSSLRRKPVPSTVSHSQMGTMAVELSPSVLHVRIRGLSIATDLVSCRHHTGREASFAVWHGGRTDRRRDTPPHCTQDTYFASWSALKNEITVS